MANSPSVDVKDILVSLDDSSLIYDFGTTLFVAEEPDSPDRCLTILDTGGYDPDIAATYERPTIQIRSRDAANQFQRAYNTLKDAVDALHGQRFTVNSWVYVLFQMGDIINIGRDEKQRFQLTANMSIQRTPS